MRLVQERLVDGIVNLGWGFRVFGLQDSGLQERNRILSCRWSRFFFFFAGPSEDIARLGYACLPLMKRPHEDIG